jgi:hypothetical protein
MATFVILLKNFPNGQTFQTGKNSPNLVTLVPIFFGG